MGVQYLYPLLVADATIATCRGWSVERTERSVFGSCSAAGLGARAQGQRQQAPTATAGAGLTVVQALPCKVACQGRP